MAVGPVGRIIESLRAATRRQDNPEVTDSELLRRFINHRDEPAFEALIQRHGALVYGVCRRVLHQHPDAEDAFQATFLVLVRKAATLRSPATLANWLYGVAHRTALEMRKSQLRRRSKEAMVMPRGDQTPAPSSEWREVLDDELARLPARYRTAIVLCDLEGKGRRKAAAELGCAEGTVASRLARGRKLLAERLARRGIGLSVAAPAAVLGAESASACVPGALTRATIDTVQVVLAGQAVSALATHAVSVADAVIRSMTAARLRGTAIGLAVTALLGAGGVLYAVRASRPVTVETHAVTTVRVTVPVKPIEDRFAIAGEVVDERGKPVPAIAVGLTMPPEHHAETTTNSDGSFRFSSPDLREARAGYKLVRAQNASGDRQALVIVNPGADAAHLRVALKPAKSTEVRVIDTGGAAVAGARVAVVQDRGWVLDSTETGTDGTARLRYPADATIGQVYALKAGWGLDYFTTLVAYEAPPTGGPALPKRVLLPREVRLKLTGARVVRVRILDHSGRPAAGISVYPLPMRLPGKLEGVHAAGGGSNGAVIRTNASGIATFDWLPQTFEGGITFHAFSADCSAEPVFLRPDDSGN